MNFTKYMNFNMNLRNNLEIYIYNILINFIF